MFRFRARVIESATPDDKLTFGALISNPYKKEVGDDLWFAPSG